MSEFLGARISLISRSDIRYVGILHQINSDDSTVSLENVKSFGTEGRKGKPEEEVAPSDQIYEYIVFRGTDVKDLRIEEAPVVKENKPPAVPNDPAIVNAGPRPGNAMPPGPPGPPGGFGYFPPPPQMGGWGRAGPPGPNNFGGMPYPPPPGWLPPGQEFPPMGPGPWNNNYPFPPGPGVPPGVSPQGNRQAPSNQGPGNQTPGSKPTPIGATADKKPAGPGKDSDMPSEPKSLGQAPPTHSHAAAAPPPPVDSKPSVEEVKAATASLTSNTATAKSQDTSKPIPTGPKGGRPSHILPAVPLPTSLTGKSAQQGPATTGKSANDSSAASSAAALRDATQAAKAAVAVAMAKLETPNGGQQATSSAMDNLTKQVNEMRVNAVRAGVNNRGGRGRGTRPAKVDVPDADFDFASSNAKFIKEDVGKEAASGSPLAETPNGNTPVPEVEATSTAPPAYNKSRSFFDNISSEAKDRLENNGQKPGGREWRGEEQRKNMETFGQGSVDGGYRGGYRGRGRGRGGRGRGYGRGGRGGGGQRPPNAQPVSQ